MFVMHSGSLFIPGLYVIIRPTLVSETPSHEYLTFIPRDPWLLFLRRHTSHNAAPTAWVLYFNTHSHIAIDRCFLLY